jgi:transcriptional regulator with XRE-family HTH domain
MDPNDLTMGERRIDPTIGERVMLSRRRRGLSQRDLAARAQMSPTALNRLERGLQSVAAERLATLARVLAISADYLLGLSQEVQPAPGLAAPREDTPDAQPPRQAGRPRRAVPVAS